MTTVWRGAATGGLALVLLLVVVSIQAARPDTAADPDAEFPTIKRTGSLGEAVELRAATITVTRFRLARSLRVPDPDRPPDLGEERAQKAVTTPGIWLVVDVTVTGKRKSESFVVDVVADRPAEYEESTRSDLSLVRSDSEVEPDFTTRGTYLFELPPRALPGAAVTVGAPAGNWDTVAVVPLGLDAARAERLVDTAPPSIAVSEGA